MGVMEMFSLKGKVALVSGGAGKFGRQIVEALAEAGAQTVMASRNTDKLRATAEELARRNLTVDVKVLDQGDEGSIVQLREQMLADYGQVDVLVNNAVARVMPKGWDETGDHFMQSMQVNAMGLFLMTREFGNAMAERGRGSIVNVGSIQGMVGIDLSLYEGLGMSSSPDYYMHKGSMMQLSHYAAAHLGPHGVRVNTLTPGGLFADQHPTFVERYQARTFLNRMANDTDLKGAIVYLASDASAYVSGANLVVDGGYTAK